MQENYILKKDSLFNIHFSKMIVNKDYIYTICTIKMHILR